MDDPLRHHGDVEVGAGLLDFAVNVFPGPRPPWLDDALHSSLDEIDAYPSPARAEAALAVRHHRAPAEVLATAGAAEAFSLLARHRRWRKPVVVHPQFTEPHAALETAGHRVTVVHCDPASGFVLDPHAVPDHADLVLLGNPTNPTGALHAADTIRSLTRPGRLVVVDEAFMDTIPDETGSLAGLPLPGVVVVRSLTKHWSIPGIRAGYLLAEAETVAQLRRAQVPWSVSAPAAAAMVACSTDQAREESDRRARTISRWRRNLEESLQALGIEYIPSSTSFVLADVGVGVHGRLRGLGIAVRRADTFPGLGPSWVRIAVRPPELTQSLIGALDTLSTGRVGALG